MTKHFRFQQLLEKYFLQPSALVSVNPPVGPYLQGVARFPKQEHGWIGGKYSFPNEKAYFSYFISDSSDDMSLDTVYSGIEVLKMSDDCSFSWVEFVVGKQEIVNFY